jgi:hypothetical protein
MPALSASFMAFPARARVLNTPLIASITHPPGWLAFR